MLVWSFGSLQAVSSTAARLALGLRAALLGLASCKELQALHNTGGDGHHDGALGRELATWKAGGA